MMYYRSYQEKLYQEGKIRDTRTVTETLMKLLPDNSTILLLEGTERVNVKDLQRKHRVLKILPGTFSIKDYDAYSEVDYREIRKIDAFIMPCTEVFHTSPPSVFHVYRTTTELLEKVLDIAYPDMLKIAVAHPSQNLKYLSHIGFQKAIFDKVVLYNGKVLDEKTQRKPTIKKEEKKNARRTDL